MKVDLPDTQKMGSVTAGHAEKNFHYGRIFRVPIREETKNTVVLFQKRNLMLC